MNHSLSPAALVLLSLSAALALTSSPAGAQGLRVQAQEDPCFGAPDVGATACPEHFELARGAAGACCLAIPLSPDELRRAEDNRTYEGPVRRHAEALLGSVTVRNFRSAKRGAEPAPTAPLTFLEYNAERGEKFDLLQTLLTNCENFAASYTDAEKAARASERDRSEYRRQLCRAAKPDIAVLIEQDNGMCRSGYRHVARELALALRYNYAYALEFLEVDKRVTGAKPETGSGKECTAPKADLQRNQHGDAILSRFPIVFAQRIPLREGCYSWYDGQKGPRLPGSGASQVRRGERMALRADLDLGEAGIVTVIAAHLEDNDDGACRQRQLERVLREIGPVRNPVILAGDLNTSGWGVKPNSVSGIGILLGSRGDVSRLRTDEPLLPYWESAGFNWRDANDLRPGRSTGSRAIEDYAPTFVEGVAASQAHRLDWIGVGNRGASRCLRPRSPETLSLIPKLGKRVSDHAPIALELELGPCPRERRERE